jgi:hypothetical protein
MKSLKNATAQLLQLHAENFAALHQNCKIFAARVIPPLRCANTFVFVTAIYKLIYDLSSSA